MIAKVPRFPLQCIALKRKEARKQIYKTKANLSRFDSSLFASSTMSPVAKSDPAAEAEACKALKEVAINEKKSAADAAPEEKKPVVVSDPSACAHCAKGGATKRCAKRHQKCLRKMFCDRVCEEAAHKKKAPAPAVNPAAAAAAAAAAGENTVRVFPMRSLCPCTYGHVCGSHCDVSGRLQ